MSTRNYSSTMPSEFERTGVNAWRYNYDITAEEDGTYSYETVNMSSEGKQELELLNIMRKNIRKDIRELLDIKSDVHYSSIVEALIGDSHITLERAMQIRTYIESLTKNLRDSGAKAYPELLPQWKENTSYPVNTRVQYKGLVYKCRVLHVSSIGFEPNISPSFWANISIPSGSYPEWLQPIDSAHGYTIGDKVTFQGSVWYSNKDNNNDQPGTSGWTKLKNPSAEVEVSVTL